jgi:hypothetical protein
MRARTHTHTHARIHMRACLCTCVCTCAAPPRRTPRRPPSGERCSSRLPRCAPRRHRRPGSTAPAGCGGARHARPRTRAEMGGTAASSSSRGQTWPHPAPARPGPGAPGRLTPAGAPIRRAGVGRGRAQPGRREGRPRRGRPATQSNPSEVARPGTRADGSVRCARACWWLTARHACTQRSVPAMSSTRAVAPPPPPPPPPTLRMFVRFEAKCFEWLPWRERACKAQNLSGRIVPVVKRP